MAGTRSSIFTPSFLDADPAAVHAALVARGYWIHDAALDRALAAEMDRDLGRRALALNVNDVAPVRYHHQTYFTHALAASRIFFDLVTHPGLRALCRVHLGERFRLKCQRYYLSGLQHELSWHTDNKTPLGARTDVAGIGVVMYLNDTDAGELQVLSGSHAWSARTGRTEFGDAEINARHAADILTIRRPAGAVILFDTRTLHRTRPITRHGFERHSVFLQVDSDIAHSEKIIVDTQYVDPEDAELLTYLGMGMPSGYPPMPPSDLSTMTNADLRGLAGRSLATLLARWTVRPVKRVIAGVRRRLARVL